jgi:hypothetical protein
MYNHFAANVQIVGSDAQTLEKIAVCSPFPFLSFLLLTKKTYETARRRLPRRHGFLLEAVLARDQAGSGAVHRVDVSDFVAYCSSSLSFSPFVCR